MGYYGARLGKERESAGINSYAGRLWNYDEDNTKFGRHKFLQRCQVSTSLFLTSEKNRKLAWLRASEPRSGFRCCLRWAAHPVTILVHFLFRPLCFPLNFSIDFRHSSEAIKRCRIRAWRAQFARRGGQEEGAIVTNLARLCPFPRFPHVVHTWRVVCSHPQG